MRSKILPSVALAFAVLLTSATANADVVIIGDTEWTCQSRCVVHIENDGSYAVWDLNGGYVTWVIR
jgi:hypothetical protein